MQWLNIGLTILGLIVGVVWLRILFYVGAFMWCIAVDGVRSFKASRSRRFVETPWGTFATTEEGWGMWEQVGPTLFVQDRDGSPDPSFIQQVPTILGTVKELEGLARAAYNFEAQACPYELDELCQVDLSNDFELVFIAEDDSLFLDYVRVRFHDGQVCEVVLEDQS